MMEVDSLKETSTGILYAVTYHPYWIDKSQNKKNSNFDENSNDLLSLKKNNHIIINSIHESIYSLLPSNKVIVIVPSHLSAIDNVSSPLTTLAKKLVESNYLVDGTTCLCRTSDISKLANGGNRSIDIHLNSIIVKNPNLIKNKEVLLIDDITTTGNSLLACQNILLNAGASDVMMFSIGYTTQFDKFFPDIKKLF